MAQFVQFRFRDTCTCRSVMCVVFLIEFFDIVMHFFMSFIVIRSLSDMEVVIFLIFDRRHKSSSL